MYVYKCFDFQSSADKIRNMSAIPKNEWGKVGDLYRSGQPMRLVANQYGVSIGAVVYVLRKSNIPRRSFAEANRLRFEVALPSFSLQLKPGKEFEMMGAMLYWAEGYKQPKAFGIDFANSDPDMALVFLKFLRSRYVLDQKRLHFSLYYYSDQDVSEIIRFWCKKLGVPASQFKNHYMKKDPQTNKRKMPYGVIHIRYNDKKLLRDVLNLIESYRVQYASVG
jgi:hypothetical protein